MNLSKNINMHSEALFLILLFYLFSLSDTTYSLLVQCCLATLIVIVVLPRSRHQLNQYYEKNFAKENIIRNIVTEYLSYEDLYHSSITENIRKTVMKKHYLVLLVTSNGILSRNKLYSCYQFQAFLRVCSVLLHRWYLLPPL